MKKAIGYTRISKDGRLSDSVSLEMQEQRIADYCRLMGLEVVEMIKENGISAAIPLSERPGGKRLTDLIKNKQAGHVVALKLDRLFRNAEDAARQTREWDKLGAVLHLVDMGGATINTGTAVGRLFFNLLAGFAEFERNMIKERTSEALQYKKKNMQVYGEIPYGFDRVGDSLVVNEKEQEIIEKIITWRSQGWSVRKIMEELNARNVPAKKGGQWWPQVIREILKNNTQYI